MLWQRSHGSSRGEGKSSSSFFHAAPSLGFLLHLWGFIEHRTLEITPQNSIDIFSEVLEYTGHTFQIFVCVLAFGNLRKYFFFFRCQGLNPWPCICRVDASLLCLGERKKHKKKIYLISKTQDFMVDQGCHWEAGLKKKRQRVVRQQ